MKFALVMQTLFDAYDHRTGWAISTNPDFIHVKKGELSPVGSF